MGVSVGFAFCECDELMHYCKQRLGTHRGPVDLYCVCSFRGDCAVDRMLKSRATKSTEFCCVRLWNCFLTANLPSGIQKQNKKT